MIYLFRKEMKKWHSVLWVVFAALALSSLSMVFFRRKSPKEQVIAKVNGKEVLVKDYLKMFNQMRSEIEMYREAARAYGISVDMLLKMQGLDNPEKLAFDRTVKNVLIDQEKDFYNIQLDPDFVAKTFAKNLPRGLKDSVGNIKEDRYRYYLKSMNTTISDYEQAQEEEFERHFFGNFVQSSFYFPLAQAKKVFEQDFSLKKFNLIKFPFDLFLSKAKEKGVNDQEIKKYFRENKEVYRVPEKRKASYWVLDAKKYSEKIDVPESSIQNFYSRNKSSLFRIPPKVKVRHILFKVDEKSEPEKLAAILDKAKSIKKEIISGKASFEDLAKKHSDDQKTSAKGGLMDFFEKGTYDKNFEKAALRLLKKGELSDIIKTQNGYELIQLEERIPASAKPLSIVRNEIIETIKAKKSLNRLRIDVERVLHEAKTDPSKVASFVKENGLVKKETGWKTEQDGAGEDVENLLIEKLFDKYKKPGQYGSFVRGDDRVLYFFEAIEKSFIPELNTINEKVRDGFLKKNAKALLKKELTNAKRSFLNSKEKFGDIAKRLNLDIKETKLMKKSDSPDVFDLSEKFSRKAFAVLGGEKQILSYKKGSDYYLAQLKGSELTIGINFKDEKDKIVQRESDAKKHLYLQGFIASLFRNARLEKLDSMFKLK